MDDPESFLLFDRELRHALSTIDATSMSMLVQFPLRVNGGKGGTISLDSPAALQARFLEVFPAGVRSAVLAQKLTDLICRTDGIGYGSGKVWVNPAPEHIGVMVVNLPHEREPPEASTPNRIDFVCEARELRLMIDTDQSGTLRLRIWNKPRSIVDEPDLEISPGDMTYEGSSPCTYPIWTFHHDESKYTLAEIGCFPESSPPPPGARGSVEISGSNQPREVNSCY
jgi:hypothetical protein